MINPKKANGELTKERWVIFGSEGLLGKQFSQELNAQNRNLLLISHKNCDIRNRSNVERIIRQNDVVINCVAHTEVDKAETDANLVFSVNAYGAANLAAVSYAVGAKFIHFSTDYVFGNSTYGKSIPFDAKKSPIGVYAKSKALSEELVFNIFSDQTIILRVSWLYGQFRENFVTKILRALAKGEKKQVVNDKFGQPTWTKDVVDMTLKVVEKNIFGIHHLTNSGFASRYDFAVRIAEFAGYSTSQIIEISSNDIQPTAFRPHWSVLKHRNETTMRHWELALNEFIKNLKI